MRLLASSSIVAAALCAATPARAEDPAKKAEEQIPKTDVDFVPLVGGDSDIGWGGGVVGDVARHDPGYDPYHWRVEVATMTTFKGDYGLKVPYQDDYLLVTFPQLVPGVVRLEIRPSFTDESTQKYYGIGNASKVEPKGDPEDPYYEYGRIHPTLLVRLRLTLTKNTFLLLGNSFTRNWLDVPPDGRLAQDVRGGDPKVRALLGSTRDHSVDFFEYALQYDSRDDETSTHRGQYHQIKIRLSPGGTDEMPYRYAQGNVTLRGYTTPIPRRLTLAARLVGSVQVGDPPFYELARYEDTFAIGGVQGVRGVPAQRYYGKIKAFGNLEARTEIVDFHALGKKLTIGAAVFFDAGRVWSDFDGSRALDGGGIGLKYGVGGGVRLKEGSTFVVRFDVAWSPDATPIGAYFAAGEAF